MNFALRDRLSGVEVRFFQPLALAIAHVGGLPLGTGIGCNSSLTTAGELAPTTCKLNSIETGASTEIGFATFGAELVSMIIPGPLTTPSEFEDSIVRAVAPRISLATPVFLQRDGKATNNRVGSAKALLIWRAELTQ